jgi:hypothetical protein
MLALLGGAKPPENYLTSTRHPPVRDPKRTGLSVPRSTSHADFQSGDCVAHGACFAFAPMHLTHLACTACHKEYDAAVPQNVCTACGKPLFAHYDLAAAAKTLTKESLHTREKSLWRYREVLPVKNTADIVTLGEGWTPLLPAPRLAAKHGLSRLFIKDEAQNPTASFKARGMTAAVSMAKQYGLKKLAAPSAGNAGGALAAYAARAGMEAHLFMPRDTPKANIIECEQMGAHVTLINGLITDCGAEVAKRKVAEGWFDVSTLKEPYRAEGKKTLGYELAEQLNWASSACGKPSTRWSAWAGSMRSAQGCIVCKPRAASRSSAPSRRAINLPPSISARTPAPPACAYRKPSVISSCSTLYANPAVAPSPFPTS